MPEKFRLSNIMPISGNKKAEVVFCRPSYFFVLCGAIFDIGKGNGKNDCFLGAALVCSTRLVFNGSSCRSTHSTKA